MEKLILMFSILIISSVFSAKISKRFNIPLLVIFIFIGMLAGSDGIGWIHYNDPDSAFFIATISLCIILFTGGLETDVNLVKPIIKEGISLSVLGVFLSMILFAAPIHFLTNLGWKLSFLASAAVASTDAAAVFSLLKFSGLKIKPKIKNIIEFESGSNDPIAYVLVILFIALVKGGDDQNLIHYIYFFLKELIIGGLLGVLFGYITERFIEKLKLEIEAMYPILLLGALGVTYSATALIHGNGYLAIYILGLSISSKKFLYKNSCVRFFSVLSWTMQIFLFLCLGLLVFPKQLLDFTWIGLFLALIMVFAVRPLSVFMSMSFFGKKHDRKSKLFISLGGFKGAVAIVFAIFTMVEKVPGSDMIFNLIFFIVLVSVIIQGSTLRFFAGKLGVIENKLSSIKHATGAEDMEYLENNMFELTITETSPFLDKSVSEINIPYELLITLIKRDSSYIHPKGKTRFKLGDRITIMCREKESLLKYFSENDPSALIYTS
ncbi:MAG TPA: potassium/proton antiporter [Lentisphaeria bacterium]|nr:MAG: K+/H+ antiporter [Lentisphaerae bacterium GWF2_38_69]HBM14939.1 potassium/proton antiporter [Lentisphaeria bacterium]